MRILDLVMAGLTLLGGLWVTFRARSIDPWARALGAAVGAAVISVAVCQVLEGHPAARGGSILSPSQPRALSSAAGVFAHAVALFLIMLVAIAGMVVYCAAYFYLNERSRSVLRTRMPATIRYAICLGIYMFVAILPMSLERHHLLRLTGQAVRGVTVAYVSLIAVLIVVALVLAFDQKVRRRRAAVVAFFCGLVIVAGASPFVWAMLATAMPALQPIGLLSIFAMASPGPAYFVLHYQLGWL